MEQAAANVRSSPEAIQAFLTAARQALPDLAIGDNWEQRWIGLDEESTRQIFDLIRDGDKTGTFTLPWLAEREGKAPPHEGLYLILSDMDGTPTLLVRLGEVREAIFGEVTAADTAIDGSPVRDPAVWLPLHTQYWNALLAPHGLTVTDDMPFWVEPFELVFDIDAVSGSPEIVEN
jgi:uncharacterized protein YhfF